MKIYMVSLFHRATIKQQYLPHADGQMSSQYGELRPSNGWDRFGSFEHPSKFSTRFASWLRYCTDLAQWRSTKLCRMFGRLLGWYAIYTFWRLLFPNGMLPAAKFTLRPSLTFSYIGSVRGLLHATRAEATSQTLRRGTRNEITELIFGRAAITLGIGPHF